MSTTLHPILEPDGRVGVPAPRGTALLRLGFRPFYLGAALAAVALMALWPAVLMGRVPVAAGLAPTDWHAHEMIFGCVAAVVVGFLFTAGKAWTGLDTPRGPALAALVALWAAGRVAGLVGGAAVLAAVDAPFLPLVAGIFARLVVRARSRRNAGVALVLALLAVAALLVMNELDRLQLALEAVQRVLELARRAPALRERVAAKLREHAAYIRQHGEDMPEIRDRSWPYGTADETGD